MWSSRDGSVSLVVWLHVLFLLACIPSAWGKQYLANGGFERGPEAKRGNMPYHWYLNGAPGLGGSLRLLDEADKAHSGKFCLVLANDKPDKVEMAVMTDSFKIEPSEYEVKVAAMGEGRFIVYLYQYDLHGKHIGSASFGGVAAGKWNEFRWLYRPRRNVGAIAFALHARAKIHFDDCSFKNLSEEKGGATGKPAAVKIKSGHLWTIPRLRKAPQTDGKFTLAEWGDAAATTGFIEIETQAASRGQPVIYAGHDEKFLYVCFVSPAVKGRKVTAAIRDRDGNVWNDDNVEVLLQPDPPRGVFFHFSAGAGGGFADMRDEEMKYNSATLYRTSVSETRWVAEFAIPFSDLGGKPVEGAAWGVNFTRGYVGPREWTCWAPTKAFADTRKFGRMRFGPEGVAARIESLGNLLTGNVELAGNIKAAKGTFTFAAGAGPRTKETPKEIDAANIHELGKAGPTIHLEKQEVNISGGVGRLSYRKNVAAGPSRLVWEVVSADGAALLQRHSLNFEPARPVVMTVVPSPARGVIEVTCDATGSYQTGVPLTGTVRLLRRGQDAPLAIALLKFTKETGKAVLSLERVTPGDYTVWSCVLVGDGETIEVASEFTRPEPISESYSKIGYDPEVPKPWTAVKVSGGTVKLWNRTIRFRGNGLPSQIESAGVRLLAGPIRLRAYVGKAEIAAASEGRTRVRQVSAGVAESSGRTMFRGLSVRAKSRTEFDGCIRVDLEIGAKGKDSPEKLVLEIPMRPVAAKLGQWHHMVWDAYSGSVPAGKGVVWSNAFMPFVWLGSTRAGLCWFAESQEGWAVSPEQPGQEITRTTEAVTLCINLATKSFAPDKLHRVTFGLQPTPVRPRPADWRRWRLGRKNPYIREDTSWDAYVLELGEQYPNYPAPKDDELTRKIREGLARGELPKDFYCNSREQVMAQRDAVHANGGRIVWYTQMNGLATETPWCSFYGSDWRHTHGLEGRSERGKWWWTDPVCPAAKGWQDFIVGTVAESLEKYNFDGLYIDLFSCRRCENAVHGCGYVDDSGNRRPIHPVWASREEMKRLYRVVHNRPNGVIIGHISCSYMPFMHGFCDSALVGEHYWAYFHVQNGRDYHEVLPLDKCRTEVSMSQWGWVPFWLPEYKTVDRGTTRQMISLLLLHDSLVLPTRMIADEYHQANAILYRLGFVDSEFVGYYDTPAPALTSNKDVLVSAYRRPAGDASRAVFIITNHGLKEGTFTIRPNVDALGLNRGTWSGVEHVDIKSRKPLTWKGDSFRIRIPAKDYAIVLVSMKP